jgi:plastocyanin
MGIVMALAKYMQDLNDTYGIIPRYDIRFIGFAGEEYGLNGARHYNLKHKNDSIITMIDLNQLGFNLSKLGTDFEDTFRLELWTNRYPLTYYLENIRERTHYEDRIDDNTTFEIKCGADQPIINRLDGGRPGNQNIFAITRLLGPPAITTLYFLKMGPWKYHHRDGLDHTDGDAITYYDGDDVNLSAEFAVNLSKFFCYQDLTWFDGDPQFTIGDSADPNTDDDWLNVTFTIKTHMPQEPATAHLVLYPKFSLLRPLWPLRFRHRESAQYLATPDGVTGYINTSLPSSFPKWAYVAKLYLCSSIGDDWLGGLERLNYLTCGTEYIESVEAIGDIDLIDIFSTNTEEIEEHTGLPIIDYMQNSNDIRPFRPLLMDLCGYYAFSDDRAKETGLVLAPAKNPPNTPGVTDGPNQIFRGFPYEFKANGTDPEGDRMRFKWYWGGQSVSGWSFNTYANDEKHTMWHSWKLLTNPDNIEVRVKACDTILNPNYHSGWSAPWAMTVFVGCDYSTTVENGFQPDSIPNENIVLVNQNISFSGITYGFTGRQGFLYDFNDSTNSSSQYPVHSFNTTGTYNVSFMVENDTANATYSAWIHVVNTSAGFNVSTLGAQPNQTINFTDVSQSIHNITGYLWDFDDGNTSTTQNTSHAFPEIGVYNVTLNVTDDASEVSGCYLWVYVEDTPPALVDVQYEPSVICLGSNVTIYADVFDNQSKIDTVMVNITLPDGTSNNYMMVPSYNSTYDYEYVLDDTSFTGWHHFTIWAQDHANNIQQSEGLGFNVIDAFGLTIPGNQTQDVHNRVSGTNYTIQANGRADSITAYINTSNTTSNITCMIYQGANLIGVSEEKSITTEEAQWITFNISGTKPNLTADSSYILCCWSNNTCQLYYYAINDADGRYDSETYVTPPNPASWSSEYRNYSIYCSYTTFPVISDVSATPDPVGFGNTVTITANVIDTAPIDHVYVNITKPDSNSTNYSMWMISENIYEYNYTDTWLSGQYNFTVWATDEQDTINSSTGHSFNVSVNATIQVCTIKNNYTGNESLNLTDPPTQPKTIGHELLDNNQILYIWNKYDHYYFNTTSGIQLTNHKDDYWSHNVMMLGYYNNDQWNLIYRTDELTGFTKNIESDNQTYVNATIWKDLSYQGYDFRLAIRYHLGKDDTDLTVIPYIKNLGSSIPYTLGFGWELKDIQIDMTPENDYIEIDDTSYYLNSTLDNSYTDLDETRFTIKEDITPNKSESLYMIWNNTLDYKVTVHSQANQSNAPVTLFIKIGTLNSGQEKYTELLWHDAADITYYFDSYGGEGDPPEAWTTNPSYMVDGNITTYATTGTPEDVELCDHNTCPGDNLGTISKVKLRAYGKYAGAQHDIILLPVYGGTTDGADRNLQMTTTGGWSNWVDITEEGKEILEGNWTWNDIQNLDCDIESEDGIFSFTLYCSRVEMKVEFTGDTATEVYHYVEEYNSDWDEPGCMVDGDEESFSYADSDGEEQLCLTTSCEGVDLGTIYQVEIRACGWREEPPANITLTPVFDGTTDGESYIFEVPEGEAAWSDWYDITNDANAPSSWNWSDITALDCRAEAVGSGEFNVLCSKIEVRVSYVEPPNSAPGVGNPSPADNEMGVSLIPTVSIVVSDADGDALNLTWLSNSSGSWQVFGTNNSVNPGIYYQAFSNATVNGQWWYWRVNVSDGENYTLSPIYKFYTGYQSKITNTGNTNFKGYLLIQVQYYNTTSGNWTVVDDTVNETTPRSLLADGPVGSDMLGLDTIFNGLVNTNNFSSYGNGTYRIYAAFRDPDGDVLELPGGAKIEATYEFTITFS